MTHGSLYSGIGGWLLAARWANIENIFTVEIDEFCNKVLKKHFNVEQYRDIKEFDGTKYKGAIDIISTSDPCQPFSFAGKRGGTTDDRFLWPETIRIIREIKPSFVVFENVYGFIDMGFEIVASDLEGEGYEIESFIIPAVSVGAWHRRDRLWIIAYRNGDGSLCGQVKTEIRSSDNIGTNGKIFSNPKIMAYTDGSRRNTQPLLSSKCTQKENNTNIKQSSKDFSNTSTTRSQSGGKHSISFINKQKMDWWAIEPNVGRVVDGVSGRVDRLKSLGNAIVPQIAYIIFVAIKEYDQYSPK